jgi:hypothetical protein
VGERGAYRSSFAPELACLLLERKGKEAVIMYSILYIIGAIVVIIVVLKLLGLY